MIGDVRQEHGLTNTKIFCKLEGIIQRLINMEQNQKQTKIPWNAKGRVCLRDFRGRLQVG